jgi:ribosomal protein S18 acetylase RimI-like enzyme
MPGAAMHGETFYARSAALLVLQIQERVTASCSDRIEAAFYASVNNEQVAALDFTKSDRGLCINMVFVKPQFRRRGIGSALLRHLMMRYPGMALTCSSHSLGKRHV